MTLDEDVLERLGAYVPDSSSFVPFVARFQMTSPVSLGHPYINGDALIAAEMMRHLLGDDFYTLPTKKPLPVDTALQLPLKKSRGVYHASVSIFDTDNVYTSVIYKRFESMGVEDKVSSKKKKIPLGAGFFKACMVTTPYKPAQEILFFFNGDIDFCRDLLGNVSHLGKDRARGYGEVADVMVEQVAHDKSLIDKENKMFMRPIPFEQVKHLGIPEHTMLLTYSFPYWQRNRAKMCTYPLSHYI
jgi:CRISPR type IV-associated protein Csf3